MNITGTLHLYSGDRREFFFVFDDNVAQRLYRMPEFKVNDLDSRKVYISVGAERFIHRRTLSFSRKQTEIKVSLCALSSKNDLGALTALYDWFTALAPRTRPAPFEVSGTLLRVQRGAEQVWELWIAEPVQLVAPPRSGRRRRRNATQERRSYEVRRQFIERNLAEVGRAAEELAFTLARNDYPSPNYSCLWRQEFLDSERIEIRRLAVIADIDVWNESLRAPELFIEVKAQKVSRRGAAPAFYLSLGEWQSYQRATAAGVPYRIWLFQYLDLRDFNRAPQQIELIVFEELNADWLKPDGYLVTPATTAGRRHP